MESIAEFRHLTKDEMEEINRLALQAKRKLKIDTSDSIESVLDKMNHFIKAFIELGESDDSEIEEYAYEFGSLYGNLIKEKHGWDWYWLDADDEIYYCITAAKQKVCCVCHNYFYNILKKEQNNNLKLLFNMIKDSYPNDWHFMVLS